MTATPEDVFDYEPIDRLREDLISVIERTITQHPRSQQTRIGPSEIGTPCVRKLAYKLSRTDQAQPSAPAWRPTVGTAVHSWLEEAFVGENRALGWDRWIMEMRVPAGEIGNDVITGSADLFDLLTGTVIDWKIPGPASIKAKRSQGGPGETYRVQAHCYGRGFARLGYNVQHVAIMFLPSAGELSQHYYWSEPYDESTALAAFSRAEGVKAALARLGRTAAISLFPTAQDYCDRCPWWRPLRADQEPDLRIGCPGHTESTGPKAGNSPSTTEGNA